MAEQNGRDEFQNKALVLFLIPGGAVPHDLELELRA